MKVCFPVKRTPANPWRPATPDSANDESRTALPGALPRTLAVVLLLSLAGFTPLTAGGRTQSRTGTKEINGTTLFYETMGEGTPILILHGGPGLDHTYLLPQMGRLAAHHRLIFFDMRGSGRSSISVDTNSMTLAALVNDIEGVRQAFGLKKVNLMGHSFGGFLAMMYAVRYPQNLNSLMLINPTPASSEERDASFKIVADRTTREDSIAKETIIHTEQFKRRSPATMEKFFRILFRPMFYDPRMADSLTLTLSPQYESQSTLLQYLFRDKQLRSYDIRSELDAVRCPTLIITGDHDQSPREAVRSISQHITGATFVLLKDCGHFPYIEKPGEFFATVEHFLDGVEK